MIGADTNVLVRLFVDDDKEQGGLAKRFFEKRTPADPAFVSAIVLAEFVWVLHAVYGIDDDGVHAALNVVFRSANMAVEREDIMKQAVARAKERNTDIVDSVIELLAADAGCQHTVTFDKTAARRIPGMELLK